MTADIAGELRQPLTHRAVLAVAVPIMIANASTPLLGIVDTTIIGQLGPAHLIGAVALGALILDFVLWPFAFLRMGTTGLASQSDGAGDADQVFAVLARALAIAAATGIALIALQSPLRQLAFGVLSGSEAVEGAAMRYFDIRIWSAPMALANYALLGWFIGLGRATTALVLQLLLNGTNIAANIIFVVGLGWDVDGVAAGTLIAETLAMVAGLALAGRELAGRGGRLNRPLFLEARQWRRTLGLNFDIMIRSVAVIFAFSFFTAQGAKSGDIILAANAVLMHFYAITGNMVDGFAFAAERFVGFAVGSRSRARLINAIRMTFAWAIGLSALASILLLAASGLIIDLMTINETVRATAREYAVWAAFSPLVGVVCVQLDGVFVGATRSADMRNMMLLSVVIYIAAWALLTPQFGNHGLWASLWVLLIARGVTLAMRLPALVRSAI